MKIISKRTLSAIMALIMIILMIPYVNAATGEYEKNNETRHTVCTALSDQAINYYTSEVKSKYKYIDNSTFSLSSVYNAFVNLANKESNSSETSYAAYKGDSPTFYQKDNNGNFVLDADNNKIEVCTNSLFYTLHNMMQETYTNKTSYSGYGKTSLEHHWRSTDTSGISKRELYTYFYSDFEATSPADMQREHIWPKSRASYHMATGGGGADLHHLRPALGTVNNKKLNWAFGECPNRASVPSYNVVKADSNVDGIQNKAVLWKFINREGDTCIDVLPQVRGDVARILLYVYVMWSQPNLFTDLVYTEADEEENDSHEAGSENKELLPDTDPENHNHDTGLRAIESLDTLLKWMREDPVDTWEMKRNDITESIQGNRNVFIDYPELAWLIFDKQSDMPSNMTTPSGMAKNGIDINFEADFVNPITVEFGDNLFKGDHTVKSKITAYYQTGINNATSKREPITTTSTDGYTDIKRVYINSGQQVEKDTMIFYKVELIDSTLSNVKLQSANKIEYEIKNTNNVTDTGYQEFKDSDNKVIYCTFYKKADGMDLGRNNGTNNRVPLLISPDKEQISVLGTSELCELKFTTSLGSHSGIYMATYEANGETIEVNTGDLVPKDTKIKILCIPDAVSTFDRISYTNKIQETKNNNDGTYTTYVTVESKGTSRESEINIYWGSDSILYNNVFTAGNFKGSMGHEAGDTFYQYAQFTENFEITGVQTKPTYANTKDLRYVAVMNSRLISSANEYGFLVATTTKKNAQSCMENGYALTYEKALEPDSPVTKIDCTGTENNISGNWGKQVVWVNKPSKTNPDRMVPDTKYKYVTMAIEDIPDSEADTVIIVRPYIRFTTVKDGDGTIDYNKTIYGAYLRNLDEVFSACAASYNQITGLAG